ncbi:MAG: hypothetical protein K2M06_08490 [Muribaculaceae bacterium]|nr:hypothetical protein [Muribaculaceae bacterium]
MKTSFHIVAAAAALSVGLPAVARSGGLSSNSQTDVAAVDTTALYPEEAQRREIIKNSKVIIMNGDDGSRPGRDSVESLLAKFYFDQFRNSQDPETPYFTFMSKDANLAMGIGGVLNVSGWFDWNGTIPGADFNTYLMTPKSPEAMRALSASAAGSAIFFNIMGRHTPIGDYRAYIEGGFDGYQNHGFKLKKAWFQIGDFTAGLAKTTFSDPAAQPDVLDPSGGDGKIDKSNVLVRYLHTWKDRWTFAGSVEFPSSQPQEQDGLTKKVKDYVPDFAALGQYQWNRGMSHVRIAGVIRSMAYRDIPAERNRHVLGWGVQLSSVVRASRNVSVFALGSVGKGIASYTGGLSNGNLDLLGTPDKPGEMYAPTTVSVTAGAKAWITPKLSSNLALATLRHFPKGHLHDDTYKYGQYLALNLVYSFTPRIQLGVEYLAGKRVDFDGSHANVNRALANFTFSF